MIAAVLLAAPLFDAALSPSLTARRLLAADAAVPRVEAHASGLPFPIDVRGGASPEIVLDLERLRDLPPREARAEYARALALAAIASPVPLVEAEQAARQWTAQVLLENAAEVPALAKELRAAELKPSPGETVLGRAAAFIARFERDPGEAYWSVESDGSLPPEAVRLTDLEDLFLLRAAELRALKEAPAGPYAPLGGRRYRGAVVRAALRVGAPGEVERLREALGSFDTVGVEPFKNAIFRWRRSLQAPAR
jgi:hypothetical protein